MRIAAIYLLDATGAALGLYQLVFVIGVFLALYSAYTWYEGRRDKEPLIAKRGKLLFLLAVIIMVTASVVSVAITTRLPF